jgi:hypothetical protein
VATIGRLGANNQLASDGTWNYAYDAAGNVSSRTNILTGEVWRYTYDFANHRLTADHLTGQSGTTTKANAFMPAARRTINVHLPPLDVCRESCDNMQVRNDS